MTLDEHHDPPGAGSFVHGPSPVAFGNPVKLYDRYDGTYFYPAPSATAEHCINFWASVRIPDEIITQARNAYIADRQQEINDDMEDTMRESTIRWMKENPEPGRKAGPASTEERFVRPAWINIGEHQRSPAEHSGDERNITHMEPAGAGFVGELHQSQRSLRLAPRMGGHWHRHVSLGVFGQ